MKHSQNLRKSCGSHSIRDEKGTDRTYKIYIFNMMKGKGGVVNRVTEHEKGITLSRQRYTHVMHEVHTKMQKCATQNMNRD